MVGAVAGGEDFEAGCAPVGDLMAGCAPVGDLMAVVEPVRFCKIASARERSGLFGANPPGRLGRFGLAAGGGGGAA